MLWLYSRPGQLHPVVSTHPVSGKQAFFVNTVFKTHTEGLKMAESDLILRFRYKHITSPEFTYRFRWQNNSVAFWDNRCIQHCALWVCFPEIRHGHRVAIRSDKPVQKLSTIYKNYGTLCVWIPYQPNLTSTGSIEFAGRVSRHPMAAET